MAESWGPTGEQQRHKPSGRVCARPGEEVLPQAIARLLPCCRALKHRPGQGCPGAGGTGPAPGTLSHCCSQSHRPPGKGPRSGGSPLRPVQGICLPLPAELDTALLAQPSPAALPALPHHDPSPAVSPRCSGCCPMLPGLSVGPQLPTYLIPALAVEQPRYHGLAGPLAAGRGLVWEP